MKVAICTLATEPYAYALSAQARRVHECLMHVSDATGTMIVVGDHSKPVKTAVALYEQILPARFEVRHVPVDLVKTTYDRNKDNNEKQSFLNVGQLRTTAFQHARELDADFCWSLDSDVLPRSMCLLNSLVVLSIDDPTRTGQHGYYCVANCTYPSQGGGGFLGGRGDRFHHIFPDVYEEEREIPLQLEAELKKYRGWLGKMQLEGPPCDATEHAMVESWKKELQKLDEEVKKCPAKGNVFALNAKGFKRRGWLENAYPGIGRGGVVPTDWFGLGCTLMNRKALALANFEGYEGGGTEDLFCQWRYWEPHGIKMALLTHSPCDHVIRRHGHQPEDAYVMQWVFHETQGECVGHLRIESRPWYQMETGEKYDPANDGKIISQRKPQDLPKNS